MVWTELETVPQLESSTIQVVLRRMVIKVSLDTQNPSPQFHFPLQAAEVVQTYRGFVIAHGDEYLSATYTGTSVSQLQQSSVTILQLEHTLVVQVSAPAHHNQLPCICI